VNFAEAFGKAALTQSTVITEVMNPIIAINELAKRHYEVVSMLGTEQESMDAAAAVGSAGIAMDAAAQLAQHLGNLARDLAKISASGGTSDHPDS
jgi:hypothetical protein